jgi:adenine C2-methylase RlmN of 23S rRNA A2503 and tRNA A37
MHPKINELQAPVSAGELLDKITILRLKQQHIIGAKKLANVNRELEVLKSVAADLLGDPTLLPLLEQLQQVNQHLWDIEDDIRECERRQDFSDHFVQLARSVYLTNDRRSEIKRNINIACGSLLVEEKSYAAY